VGALRARAADYGLRLYKDAIAEWEKVLAAAPEFEPVYFDLVDGCLQLKDYDRATRTIRTAAGRWPKDSDIFNALGVVQVARGALDDEIKSFGAAVAGPATASLLQPRARARTAPRPLAALPPRRRHGWRASRLNAIENYNRYLEIGAFGKSAREAWTRLRWTPPPRCDRSLPRNHRGKKTRDRHGSRVLTTYADLRRRTARRGARSAAA
jgi:tetratricopeptide (TPR) repeat protein